MPALRRIMTDIQSGNIGLVDVTTDIASPFAENLLFGYVGTVMYQYDVPQAERSAQLLSIDPDVLERLLGQADFSAIMDPRAVHEVEEELGRRTFWNELPDDDIDGRVARYAKTHGPFTVERMMVDLSIDAAGAVHAWTCSKHEERSLTASPPRTEERHGCTRRCSDASGPGRWPRPEPRPSPSN